ncbi:zinc finger MYM-type protein 1-like [Myzus persicae]|uniref:zinc finger MYM-type protein 1-like n=1 Tax=Myzus persicae TaxID=13164 RepID=UPI000B932B04|nr:zinc finger MYM-type protein 1-like [Myzus persicae]
MKNRSSELNNVNEVLTFQLETEKIYWKNVLTRVCAVVKSLSSRGLPFRGDNENIGSLHNGNFLMCLEMIAEFDPFLANHLANYGNPGKGYTSYLSHSTYEQFIKLMVTKVQNQIVEEVINAQYFSIVIDSTPDIAHVDQLSFILRYVNNKGLPVERFLCFLENVGHKSQCMADTVFSILKKYNIDIAYLSGQSYDNAKNMSGIYSGLQARIKEVSPLADFVPCSAHSLNLVGSCAASCCKEANIFFNFIQSIYTFFSSSTHRWNLLKVKSTLKNLSEIRWSAREDACKAINQNWDSVIQSLCDISENINEKSITQNEARGLLRLMNRFEVTFMSLFWGDLLQRFNVVSKHLQSVNIDVCKVCDQYEALIKYVVNLRSDEMFQHYEVLAMKKCSDNCYETIYKRKKKRTKHHDETASIIENEINLTGSLEFKVNTYLVICDSIIKELTSRKLAYDNVITKYSFFLRLTKIKPSEVRVSAEHLYSMYSKDLDVTFINECVHFQSYIQSMKNFPSTIIDMSSMLKIEGLEDIYPYVLKNALVWLDNWEPNVTKNFISEEKFLTKNTAEGLRITIQSSIDIINYLHMCGFDYVLTSKIKQDCVEKFFGIIRQVAGPNDHPLSIAVV